MSYRRPSLKRNVSQRGVRNVLTFWAGGTQMEQGTKRGKQPESEVHPEVARWRNHKPGLVLERNKRRLATPVGYDQPIMLGWLVDGSPDWLGYLPVTITPSMVGKTLAVFAGVEVKRKKGGTLSNEQEAFLNALKDAGGIAGVARSYEDCEAIYQRWVERVTADER